MNSRVLIGLAIFAAIAAAWYYSSRPAMPFATGEPDEWPNPPGTDMPNPTVNASTPRPGDWRYRVIQASALLASMLTNAMNSGLAPKAGQVRFVTRLADESEYATRDVLNLLVRGVRTFSDSDARSRAQLDALRGFNAALRSLTREINTLDSPTGVTRQPDAPMIYTVASA